MEPGYSGLGSLNEARSLDTFLWLLLIFFFSFPFFSFFPPLVFSLAWHKLKDSKGSQAWQTRGGGGSGEMKEGLSPAFSSSSHTPPALRAPNDSQPHLEEAGQEAGPVCAASRTSPHHPTPATRGGPAAPPSQVTLGDKVPEMALKDVCPTPELALRKISSCAASRSCPSPWRSNPAGGRVGDSLGGSGGPRGCAEAEVPVHTPQTHT